MKTPLFFKLDIFIISEILLQKEFIIFSEIPFQETISMIVDEFTTITQDKYEIIEIDDNNILNFIGSQKGQFVLSWKNSDEEFKQMLVNKKSKKMVVQYVNYEKQKEEIEKNKIDDVDWEID